MATVMLLLTLVGLFGRLNRWMRFYAAGTVPAPPLLSTRGPDIELHYDTLGFSCGGVMASRTTIVSGSTSPPVVIEEMHRDGTTTILRPGRGVTYHGDWQGHFPRLEAQNGGRLFGLSWIGVVTDSDGNLQGFVIPLPVLAVAAGAWPATAAWRWWRRRRRGELAGGFEVIPRPTEEPGSDEPRHDVP